MHTWCENESDPIDRLRRTPVRYGTALSSYQSFRSLLELAKNRRKLVGRNIKIDDLLTGLSTLEQAKMLQNQHMETLQ